jgi:eukaryotic-like serine/threonine-protein kinase
MIGQMLGPYRVTQKLGEGGMGEVYKARDTRLDRTVAIKILPAHLASSPESRQRFEREARTISQLSHPHICTLYDVGREGPTEYLVMEYLEGETLSDRLGRGPLPFEAVCRQGAEIADALENAHRLGIVHRDLKPANIMLTRSGVKLLDFGLARAFEPDPSGLSGMSELPTAALRMTEQGTVMGTFPYMAPEQLEEKAADRRSDIFALGAVLYEMATGKRAFPGASRGAVVSAILKDDPPAISTSQPGMPPTLDRVVSACLAKDPDDRWQSAGDVARELRWAADAPPDVASRATPRRGSRERVAWAVAALAVMLGIAASFVPHTTPRVVEELTRFVILPPAGSSILGFASLSPDARRLALLLQDEGQTNAVAIRPLDTLETRLLPGTNDARGMFWSPDGREIGFFSDGKLKRMSADGGPTETICESGGAFSGAWGSQGTILFATEFGDPIVAVPATGGTPRPVTSLDTGWGDVAHFHPTFLPDGRHFLFLARNLDLDKSSIVLASIDSKETRRLFHADSSAVYAADGYLLYELDDVVFARRFDPVRLALAGDSEPAFQNVHCLTADNFLGLTAAGSRVAYLSWSLRRRLVWVDRAGRELGTLGDVGGYMDVRISPDGQRVAVAERDPSHGRNFDVWVLDASRGTGTRITAERSDEFDPAWFPDGSRLAYVSDRFGFYDLFERPVSGGAETILIRTKQDKVSPVATPDGRHLVVHIPQAGRFARVLIPLSGGELARLSGDSRFSEEHTEISSDGRWTAFDSTESGQREVYVQPLPQGPKRQVSIGGGEMPVWSRNGSELFYAARDGNLKSVTVRGAADQLQFAPPQSLFPLQLGVSGELPIQVHPYDVSPDGKRFLVIRGAPDGERDGAVVVTSWTAVLKAGR